MSVDEGLGNRGTGEAVSLDEDGGFGSREFGRDGLGATAVGGEIGSDAGGIGVERDEQGEEQRFHGGKFRRSARRDKNNV